MDKIQKAVMLRRQKDTTNKPTTVVFNYKFASIIAPGNIKDYSLLSLKSDLKVSNKIYIKQSYILMSWLSYVQKKNWSSTNNKFKAPKFFVLPKKVSKFTLTKAPMAHKTFSQEQYSYTFFKISISFKKLTMLPIPDINSSIYFILNNPLNMSFIETNLFFITKLSLSHICTDPTFYVYK